MTQILWKELDGLKDELSQAESAVTLSIKDCDAKIAKLNELRDLCGKAHGVRDEAYNNFKKLKDKVCCQNYIIYFTFIIEICALHFWERVLLELSSLNIVPALSKGNLKLRLEI